MRELKYRWRKRTLTNVQTEYKVERGKEDGLLTEDNRNTEIEDIESGGLEFGTMATTVDVKVRNPDFSKFPTLKN